MRSYKTDEWERDRSLPKIMCFPQEVGMAISKTLTASPPKNAIVLGGLGVTVVSTPKGIMTGAACQRAGVGGEVLCNVW